MSFVDVIPGFFGFIDDIAKAIETEIQPVFVEQRPIETNRHFSQGVPANLKVKDSSHSPFQPPANARGQLDYSQVDAHALATPKEAEQSVQSLASYLKSPWGGNQEFVARAIFRWITENIAYDVENFMNGRCSNDPTYFKQAEAAMVLKTRIAVCAGYANLFHALATESGVVSETVRGNAKTSKMMFNPLAGMQENHMWNGVKLDGDWVRLDLFYLLTIEVSS